MGDRIGSKLVLASCALGSCSFHATEIARDANNFSDVAISDSAPDTFVSDTFVPDGPPGALYPANCAAALASGSGSDGLYEIDADGSGSNAPFTVWCDMTTNGGGWTIVFLAASDNYTSPPGYAPSYAQVAPLLPGSTVLMAYRGSDNSVRDDYATFGIPPDWKNGAPFQYPSSSFVTDVSINGSDVGSARIQYGDMNFDGTCGSFWGSFSFGRVCVVGTTAPFYNGFNSADPDGCDTSDVNYGTTACGARRFSLAVR